MHQAIVPKHTYVLSTNKTMFAVHVDQSTKLLCFKNKDIARVCRLNAAKHKHRHGVWPSRIMDSETKKDPVLPRSKRMKLKDIYYNELSINEVETGDMHTYCRLNNMGLLLCHKLEYNDEKIQISGTEFDDPDVNFDMQKQRLNQVLSR